MGRYRMAYPTHITHRLHLIYTTMMSVIIIQYNNVSHMYVSIQNEVGCYGGPTHPLWYFYKCLDIV
jgi:hypothetical protein